MVLPPWTPHSIGQPGIRMRGEKHSMAWQPQAAGDESSAVTLLRIDYWIQLYYNEIAIAEGWIPLSSD